MWIGIGFRVLMMESYQENCEQFLVYARVAIDLVINSLTDDRAPNHRYYSETPYNCRSSTANAVAM